MVYLVARATEAAQLLARTAAGVLARVIDFAVPAPPSEAAIPSPLPPDRLLAELLDRSLSQSAGQARQEAFTSTLRQLLPDEARILSVLAGGAALPVVTVEVGPVVGSGARRPVRTVSAVGTTAGIPSRDLVPRYLARLIDLGVAELGPEAPDAEMAYDMLEADAAVRDVLAEIEGQRRNKARLVRQSLRLTPFGAALWEFCRPGHG